MSIKLACFVGITLERHEGTFKRFSGKQDNEIIWNDVHMKYSIIADKWVQITEFETDEKTNARSIQPTIPEISPISFTRSTLRWMSPAMVFGNENQSSKWAAKLDQIISDLQKLKFKSSNTYTPEEVFMLEISRLVNIAYSQSVWRSGLSVVDHGIRELAYAVTIPCIDGDTFITYWDASECSFT